MSKRDAFNAAGVGPPVSARRCRPAGVGPPVSDRRCRTAGVGPGTGATPARAAGHVRHRDLVDSGLAGWRLAAGGWRLAAGGWRLAAGGWRLASLVSSLEISISTRRIDSTASDYHCTRVETPDLALPWKNYAGPSSFAFSASPALRPSGARPATSAEGPAARFRLGSRGTPRIRHDCSPTRFRMEYIFTGIVDSPLCRLPTPTQLPTCHEFRVRRTYSSHRNAQRFQRKHDSSSIVTIPKITAYPILISLRRSVDTIRFGSTEAVGRRSSDGFYPGKRAPNTSHNGTPTPFLRMVAVFEIVRPCTVRAASPRPRASRDNHAPHASPAAHTESPRPRSPQARSTRETDHRGEPPVGIASSR